MQDERHIRKRSQPAPLLTDANLSPEKEQLVNNFIAYWNDLRQDGDVPRRADVDPGRIEALLSHAFIAEKIMPGLARFRVAGLSLCDLMGMEVRGMPVGSFIDPSHRTALSDALVEVFERPAMLSMDLTPSSENGDGGLNAKLVILPLRSDLGDISRVLGCLVTEGDIGRVPCRFLIASQTLIPLSDPLDTAFTAAHEMSPAFLSASDGQHRSERPYLRVVR